VGIAEAIRIFTATPRHLRKNLEDSRKKRKTGAGNHEIRIQGVKMGGE
jgi:hypothetical protein